MNDSEVLWGGPPQMGAIENKYRIRGVGMTQSMSAPFSWDVAAIIQPNETPNCS